MCTFDRSPFYRDARGWDLIAVSKMSRTYFCEYFTTCFDTLIHLFTNLSLWSHYYKHLKSAWFSRLPCVTARAHVPFYRTIRLVMRIKLILHRVTSSWDRVQTKETTISKNISKIKWEVLSVSALRGGERLWTAQAELHYAFPAN